ncbi:MAG: replicative DNA helicase, partial [Bacteroidia bacterium]
MAEPNFEVNLGNTENVKPKKEKKEAGLQNFAHLGKTPPRALDMEQAVIGALLLEKNALHRVMDVLKPEMFWDDRHKVIFETIIQLFQDSKPLDMLIVKDQLKKNGQLEHAGGALYLAEITSRVASAANIEYHSRVIAEKFILRQLITISDEVIRDAYQETTDVFELLDLTEQKLFEVSETHLRRNYLGMPELVMKTLARLEELKNKDTSGVTGIPSGFMELDKLTSGWQKTDLVIVAARPAMGKCLGKDTPILMYDGSIKLVQDVKVGDLLMGDDSTPRKVLSLARGTEKMYWVRQNKAMDYRVNESHILSLKRSRNEGKHKSGDILNISVKEYVGKSEKFKSNYKGYKVSIEFEEKNMPLAPYFIGLWLGDGHSYSSRITNQDEEIIIYMREYAESLGLSLQTYLQEDKCNNYAITKGSRGGRKAFSIQEELRKLNLLENKHIPEGYLLNSTENRLELLAGLIDSDGHYDETFNCYEITQKNETLATQIKFLCDTLGFKVSLNEKQARITSLGVETTVYRVRLFGNLDIIPAKVARKKARPLRSHANWRVTGITLEEDKIDDYYGFEIDGNHLFLLGDCTVTHNTAFTLTVARNAAVQFNIPVAFFSLEMAAVQLTQRLVCAEAEIDMQKIRTGRLEAYEWQQLITRIGNLSDAPLFIDDTPALSIMDLRAKCRRLKAEKKIEMVIIDYLQLMTGNASKGGNREQEIAGISRSLKELAKELDVCVIALAQLSRAVETRGGDKKPMLSDLRESGCITGDSLITDAHSGRLIPIKELAERSIQSPVSCLALDNQMNVKPHSIVKAFYSGKKQVFELQTKTGKKIKASANHPFFTINGWTRLDALQIGEKIATPRKITVENPSNPISEQELILLAHLIGDGCILPKSPYHYTSADMANIEIVNECAKNLFGIEANIVPQENWWHTYLKTPYPLTHKVKHPITLWYEKLGLERIRSYEKKLPDSIFECDDARIALFLKHLWATDGNISWKKIEGRKDSTAIYYGTTSEKLAEQVQYLLLRFGIISTIRITQKAEYRKSHNVWIDGSQNQLSFLTQIGCFGKRGEQINEMIQQLQTIEPNPNNDVIPKEAWKNIIEPIKEKAGISWRNFAEKMQISYSGSNLFESGISRKRMEKIAHIFESEQLKNLAQSDIYWDEIQSITPLGIEDVYDVTVEDVHNFTSNGILLHNSIEQDADMVMALYRPEYYGFETDEEGNSTKGQAQVIIMKQRNGPTGEAKLAFLGSFGKFADANVTFGANNTFQSGINNANGQGNTIEPQKDYFSNAGGGTPN